MPPPRVSVVIAAFNAGRWLDACLTSVRQQTFRDWEAIICDDASTDDTARLLAECARGEPRLRILKNEVNLGNAATINRCLDAASGTYIAIQDADDVSLPDRLAVLVEFLDRYHMLAFASSGMFLFDDRGTYAFRQPRRALPTRWSFLYSTPFFHAPTMFRRGCLKAVGGYRQARETRRGLDFDLFMRLYAAGFRGGNLPACLYGYRVGPEALRRRRYRFRIDETIIRYKGYRALRLFPWALPFVPKPLLAGAIPLATMARIGRQLGRTSKKATEQ